MTVSTKQQPYDLAAITQAVRAGNEDFLKAIREDSHKRHDLRGVVDGIANEVSDVKSRIRGVEDKAHALLGDGTGETGMVHQLKRGQEETARAVDDVQRDVSYIKDTVEKLSSQQNNQQTQQDMWSGMGTGVKLLLGSFVGLAGIGMFFLTLYEVMKHAH